MGRQGGFFYHDPRSAPDQSLNDSAALGAHRGSVGRTGEEAFKTMAALGAKKIKRRHGGCFSRKHFFPAY
jgi:hypothetical protein